MSHRTIATWSIGQDVSLTASVKLKAKEKQDVSYFLHFTDEEHRVEIDARDARVLLAANGSARSLTAEVDEVDDADDADEGELQIK